MMQVIVRGHVQGVGFRWFVRERARALGLSGWVRNLPDGSVEIAASGDASQLRTLRQEAGRGPEAARVSAVEDRATTPDPGEALPYPFEVRR